MSVVTLEGQFYPVFRVQHIKKHQDLLVNRQTHLKGQYKQGTMIA